MKTPRERVNANGCRRHLTMPGMVIGVFAVPAMLLVAGCDGDRISASEVRQKPSAVAVMPGETAAVAWRDARHSPTPKPAASLKGRSDPLLASSSIARAIQLWNEGDEEAAVLAVLDGAAATDWESELLAFPETAIEYASWSDAERATRAPEIFERGHIMRYIARAMLREAESKDADDDVDDAEKLVEAVARLGRANSREDIVRFGVIIGNDLTLRAQRASTDRVLQ